MARLSQMGKTSTVVFTSGFAAEFKNLSLDGPTRGEVGVTHFGSGDYLEFDPASRADLQSGTMDINFDPELYDVVLAMVNSTVIETVTVTYALSDVANTTPATLVFGCYVTGLPLDMPSVDGISASIALRLTGSYVVTPESA